MDDLSDDLSRQYEEGKRDRRRSVEFANPYPRGSREARKYYEGWCLQNLVGIENTDLSKGELMSSITTASGLTFHIDAPQQSKIQIRDIAAALSKICRFNGHTSCFYSVAEHSVRVSQIVPEQLKLAALLHDAAEAYVGDIVTPLKRLVGNTIAELERRILEVIGLKFGISPGTFEAEPIKIADKRLLATEQRDLMAIVSPGLPDPLPDKIAPMSGEDARLWFLNRFAHLLTGVEGVEA